MGARVGHEPKYKRAGCEAGTDLARAFRSVPVAEEVDPFSSPGAHKGRPYKGL